MVAADKGSNPSAQPKHNGPCCCRYTALPPRSFGCGGSQPSEFGVLLGCGMTASSAVTSWRPWLALTGDRIRVGFNADRPRTDA